MNSCNLTLAIYDFLQVKMFNTNFGDGQMCIFANFQQMKQNQATMFDIYRISAFPVMMTSRNICP